MNHAADPLKDLRDIHLPVDPAFWPPAVGWWMITALGLALLFLLTKYIQRWRARHRPLKVLTKRLTAMDLSGDARQRQRAIQQMSSLARQYAIARFGRASVAGLHGHHWLTFLNESGAMGDQFSHGVGSALAEAPYRPSPQVDLEALRRLLLRWARRCHPKS